MEHVCQSWYVCKSITLIDFNSDGIQFNDVVLGIDKGSSGVTDIIIKGTAGNFVVGEMYYIGVSKME